MNKNVFWLLIVLPNIIVWSSPYVSRALNFYASDYKKLFLFIIFLPVIGSLAIVYISFINKNKHWLISGAILLILTIAIFLLSYSLSNFGF